MFNHDTDLALCSVLVMLFAFILYLTWVIHKLRQIRAEHFAEIMHLKVELERRTPSELCLRDIVGLWHRPQDSDERLVLVKFRSTAALGDFFRWLRREHTDASLRARAEALRSGQGKSAPGSNAKHT